ncbi:MAG TPA: hypothetical protein VG104_01420 [Candidatus Dormibacteraeota bacterium]|jgi:hypothetical protein|nr:hypothetical protein [Candidatus Dormibacteraeota bacterium]
MAAVYEPPVSDQRGELVIRPSWAFLARWERHIAWLFLLGSVYGFIRIFGRHQTVIGLVAGLGFIGVWLSGYALYITAYMLGTRITVTADDVLVTHWFRSTARVPRAAIARVVRCSVDEGVAHPTVFAFSPAGKCVISLRAERWDRSELERIWQHLGITPQGSWTDRVSDIERRFPGAF